MSAQGLESMALYGRHGDNIVGHLTPGEMVLPRPLADDPILKRQLFNAFQRHEINPYQYTVGHYENSINPLTGVPEFGFFKKLGKFLKKAAPTIGKIVGFAYGGPTGAAIGGGLGTAVQGGDIGDIAKSAAFGYVGGKMAVGAGVQPGGGGASLNPFGDEFLLKGANLAGPQVGEGGIGGFFQDIGASGGAAIGGEDYVARANLPSLSVPGGTTGLGGASPWEHLKSSWGGLSGLQKAGAGALGMTALGGFQEGEDTSRMPEPSGELGGYLQNPLTPATLPTQYGPIEGSSAGGSAAGALAGLTGGVLDPDTLAYLRATMDDEDYSKLMFPEFERLSVKDGGRIGYAGGGYAKLPDGSQLPELDLRNIGGAIQDLNGSGTEDTVDAKLADGEFVFTKLAAKGLGDGDHEKGIENLYAMMKKSEQKAQILGLGRA